MTTFFGLHDAKAIVDHHIKTIPGQRVSTVYLESDPREEYENKYAEFRPLNWNHVGHLKGGDKVYFQDQDGSFGCITIGKRPAPAIRSPSEALEKVKEIQGNMRGE